MADKLDLGMDIYEIEEEMGLYEEDPKDLADKYLLMQEFPAQDIVALEAQKADAAGAKEGGEATQADPSKAQAEDASGGGGEEGAGGGGELGKRFKEKLLKLGEELDMIVSDGMWDLMYDYCDRLLLFKAEAEAAKDQKAVDEGIKMLEKVARVIFMAPETKLFNIEMKIYIVQDRIIPIMPELTLPMERIWEFLLKKREKKIADKA